MENQSTYYQQRLYKIFSTWSREDLTKALRNEFEKRKETDRIFFYAPNSKGADFIDLVGHGRSLVSVLSAANGVGKTALVVNILGNIIFGQQNRYFDGPLFKTWPHPPRIRYITDPKALEEIGPFHTEVQKWWPQGRYTAEKAGKTYFSQYKSGRWIVDVMSYDQDVKQFESGTLGMIICDEPPPKAIYHACIGRLRMGGLMLVVMTPLTSAAWFYDEVVPKHQEHIVYATMEDACTTHGTNGHLDHQQIERMIAEMSPEEVEARVYGKALYLRGLIFKTFDPKVHVLKEQMNVPSQADVYQAVDPHSDKPFACIWGFPDQNGDFYIVDEWPNEEFSRMHNCQLGVDDYARIFRDKEHGWNVVRRIIDRHFADVRHVVNRKTLREEFQEIGFYFEPSYQATEEIETGILRIRDYLKYDATKPLSPLNKPKLFVNPSCKNTIKALLNWARDPDNGKVKEDYKDFCDVMRYLTMDDPRVYEPVPAHNPVKRYG